MASFMRSFAVVLAVALIAFAGVGLPVGAFAFQGGQGLVAQANVGVQAGVKAGKARSVTVFRYGWSGGKSHSLARKTVRSRDVTGDARVDAVEISVVPSDTAGLARSVTIDVNGSRAWSYEAAGGSIDNVTISVITLKNKMPFVFTSVFCADGASRQELCQFQDGVLAAVASNELLSKDGVSDAYISSAKPTGNRVVLTFEFASTLTGVSRTSFAYAYRDSTLRLSSETSRALRYVTASSGEYTRKALVAARRLAVYDGPELASRAFTVRAGKKVRPLAVRLQGDKLLYQVKYGKKTGWLVCPTAGAASGAPLLTGAFGRVPLEAQPPAYVADVPLSAAELQVYGNHALFLARNELFARHGQAFESDELAALFGSSSWYAPLEGSQVQLTAVEEANAALMRSIEQNRNSPYVS